LSPWRKRLGDLRKLIRQAEDNYFEPDVFRMNVNGAIQTARTVTFLIQKDKSRIPGFERWYDANVIQAFRNDPVMDWLKDSRNYIEKEGDLELYSGCELQTLFSYTEEGPRLSLKDSGYLFIGLTKLMRRMRKIFPTGIFRDSAISIDRRWVATTLPSHELVEALLHGYARLLEVVESLEKHLGTERPPPRDLDLWAGAKRNRRSYVKTDDGKIYTLGRTSIDYSRADLEKIQDRFDRGGFGQKFKDAFRVIRDVELAVDRFGIIASDLYVQDGYHVTLGILLGSPLVPPTMVSPQFADHADKLIFWHEVARMADYDKEFCGLVFISEIWIRSIEGFPQRRIRELEITGEALQIVSANSEGQCALKTIPLIKSNDRLMPDLASAETHTKISPNFLAPVRTAWAARSARQG
jgi:hypothetical protein